jgi:glycosyltransferase involved in cell wall biosynthesis
MRILFLSQIVPWPLDAGPKIKSWNVLQYLKEAGHEVWFVSFIRAEEEKHREKVEQLCDRSWFVPLKRSRISDAIYFLKSRFSGRPFLVERDRSVKMRRVVKSIVSKNKIDIYHADQITMTQYVFPEELNEEENTLYKNAKSVFDAHNATWKILDRAASESKFPALWLYQDEAIRLKKYERHIIESFDHTFTVSDADKEAFLELFPGHGEVSEKISVVPIGINTSQYPNYVDNGKEEFHILTLGSLNYPPNAEGIRWFMKDVYPKILSKIPQAFLWVIGKNPPPDFYEIEKQYSENMKITGYVDDLNPYFSKSSLAVIPVRVGGGMRVRILECFARQIPVITTSIGAEGIDVNNLIDILIEDDETMFAERSEQVLRDQDLQEQIIKNAKILVERKYDWSVVLKNVSSVFDALVDQVDQQ